MIRASTILPSYKKLRKRKELTPVQIMNCVGLNSENIMNSVVFSMIFSIHSNNKEQYCHE